MSGRGKAKGEGRGKKRGGSREGEGERKQGWEGGRVKRKKGGEGERKRKGEKTILLISKSSYNIKQKTGHLILALHHKHWLLVCRLPVN